MEKIAFRCEEEEHRGFKMTLVKCILFASSSLLRFLCLFFRTFFVSFVFSSGQEKIRREQGRDQRMFFSDSSLSFHFKKEDWQQHLLCIEFREWHRISSWRTTDNEEERGDESERKSQRKRDREDTWGGNRWIFCNSHQKTRQTREQRHSNEKGDKELHYCKWYCQEYSLQSSMATNIMSEVNSRVCNEWQTIHREKEDWQEGMEVSHVYVKRKRKKQYLIQLFTSTCPSKWREREREKNIMRYTKSCREMRRYC